MVGTNLFVEMMWAASARIEELYHDGNTGKQIADALRDEGFPLEVVRLHMEDFGFYAEIRPFLDLKGLFVSDNPLQTGQDIPVYDGTRANKFLTIWLSPGGSNLDRPQYLN